MTIYPRFRVKRAPAILVGRTVFLYILIAFNADRIVITGSHDFFGVSTP